MLRRIRQREQDSFDRLLRSIDLVETNRNKQQTETSTKKANSETEENENNKEAKRMSSELKNRKRNEVLDRQRFENFLAKNRRSIQINRNPNQGYKKIYEDPTPAKKSEDKEELIKAALKIYVTEEMDLRFPKKILISAITRAFGVDPIQIGHFDENTIRDIIRATFGGNLS